MDEFHFELAARVELAQRMKGIDDAREKARLAELRPPEFSGLCPLCEEPVPERRIATGHYTCLDCAEAAELAEKMRKLG